MHSPLDALAAADWSASFPEVKKTITRRIGGIDNRTEQVEANVDFDEKTAAKFVADAGGLMDSTKGQYTEVAGVLDIATDQENGSDDTWVIDSKVYKQLGEAIGTDGGCKTVVILRRTGIRAREPRVTGRGYATHDNILDVRIRPRLALL